MGQNATYLDHYASAPLLPEAQVAMYAAFELCGNPSSVHAHGRALRAVIDEAREKLAMAAGAEPGQVVFTASATEAITQAIVAGARANGVSGIVVSGGEHRAVLTAAEASGKPVETVGLDRDGLIDFAALDAVLKAAEARGETRLVALHLVNNETGVVQPLGRIAARIGASPHFLFVDAVQGFGKLPLDFAQSAIDLVAISGHKVGAPAGIGALLLKSHMEGTRLIPGGGQERGRRGGTEATALIAGFGAAAAVFADRYRDADPGALIARAEAGLRRLAPDLAIFGAGAARLGNVSAFAVPGLNSAVALMALDLAGISISSGSACASGKVAKSHVLAAMGVLPALVEGGLRVSVGWNSTGDDIEKFLLSFGALLERRRGQAAA